MNNYIVKTIFTKKECDEILRMKTKSVGRITMGSEFESSWINGNQTNYNDTVIEADSWVYDRLMENMDMGSFATCDGMWALILKEYNMGDEVGIHFDNVRGVKRISCFVNLNDDYEGGDTKFLDWNFDINTGKDNAEFITIKPEIGQMIQCPIIIPHGVTKITKGVRKQLVTWFTGEYLNW